MLCWKCHSSSSSLCRPPQRCKGCETLNSLYSRCFKLLSFFYNNSLSSSSLQHSRTTVRAFEPFLWCMKFDQVLNALAVIDEYKLRIVDAEIVKIEDNSSALEVYTKLLSRYRDDCVQEAAAHGLWQLAFMNKGRIINEKACIEGWYLCLSYDTIRYEMLLSVRSKADISQLNLPRGTDN